MDSKVFSEYVSYLNKHPILPLAFVELQHLVHTLFHIYC